jgi:hypothetical protein
MPDVVAHLAAMRSEAWMLAGFGQTIEMKKTEEADYKT